MHKHLCGKGFLTHLDGRTCLWADGKMESMHPRYAKQLGDVSEKKGDKHFDTLNSCLKLATLKRGLGDYDGCETLLRKILAVLEEGVPVGNPCLEHRALALANTHDHLGITMLCKLSHESQHLTTPIFCIFGCLTDKFLIIRCDSST